MAKRAVIRETLSATSSSWCELNGFPKGIYVTFIDKKNENRQIRSDRLLRRHMLPRKADDSSTVSEALSELKTTLLSDLKGLELALRLPTRQTVRGNTRIASVRAIDFDDQFSDAEMAHLDQEEEIVRSAEFASGAAFSLSEADAISDLNIARGFIREIRKMVGRQVFIQALEIENVFRTGR